MPSKFDPNKHHRQSIRLRGWDYTTPGGYFITICTHQRENLFEGDILRELAENGWQHIPTQPHAGHVALDEWVVMPNHLHGILRLAKIEAGDDETEIEVLHLDETPHRKGEAGRRGDTIPFETLHRPASPLHEPLPNSPSPGVKPGSVGAIIGNFKSLVTRRINNIRRTAGEKVWQRGYYDRIIRSEAELADIRQYIWDNPKRWAEDRDNLDPLLAKMRLVLND